MTVHPPKFSVLGDSISTFQGYCPVGAEHYAPDTGAATGPCCKKIAIHVVPQITTTSA